MVISTKERNNMPYLSPGEKLNTGFSEFFKLKEVGDKLRFRIIGIPYVEGKHFFESPEGWDIKPCSRINDGVECNLCNTFFNALKVAKKSGDDKKVKEVKDSKEMRPFKASVIVYYPVLDRTEGKFVIFQTTMGIREKIEAETALGTKVMNVDFTVLRSAKNGSNTYTFSKVDSADTPPLSDEEKEEVKRGQAVKLDEIVAGSADNDSGVAQEVQTVVV